MKSFEEVRAVLRASSRKWIVTGAAGFIGSTLVDALLRLGQNVVGLDNLALGSRENIEGVRAALTPADWARFTFVEGDIRAPLTCRQVCAGADVILHQAGMGSVPRSINHPDLYHENNVTGTLNMLFAARDSGVRRFVYASSSSVYGNHPGLPKREAEIGDPLSPYAATKRILEIYAQVLGRTYGLETIGLRYFNVFGPRQDPNGDYAAVIPKWISAMLLEEPIYINGTGETSRDFCYVQNVVQANLLAALTQEKQAMNDVFNVAVNVRTTLNELFELLRERVAVVKPSVASIQPRYRDFRPGDVLHSQADISKAERLLGYAPTHDIRQGLDEALPWYLSSLAAAGKR
jgi:UDP-N-acetylglucosamine 4-epimerase